MAKFIEVHLEDEPDVFIINTDTIVSVQKCGNKGCKICTNVLWNSFDPHKGEREFEYITFDVTDSYYTIRDMLTRRD